MTDIIFLASDHAGFALKEHLKGWLAGQYPALQVRDLGTDSGESVDYPDYGFRTAEEVTAAGDVALGVMVCGSGIGISIAANRVPGARAALCISEEMARLSREHNNANILALGSRLISEAQAEQCLQAFLSTPFAGGRHQRRVDLLG
jgi:ribose 5-phosphate isomerase B